MFPSSTILNDRDLVSTGIWIPITTEGKFFDGVVIKSNVESNGLYKERINLPFYLKSLNKKFTPKHSTRNVLREVPDTLDIY